MRRFTLPLSLLLLTACQAGGTLVVERRECDPDADVHEQKADCDDGDPGTVDRCEAGACSHLIADCDPLDPPDVAAAACEDGDPCTVARCAPTGCEQFLVGHCP